MLSACNPPSASTVLPNGAAAAAAVKNTCCDNSAPGGAAAADQNNGAPAEVGEVRHIDRWDPIQGQKKARSGSALGDNIKRAPKIGMRPGPPGAMNSEQRAR